MESKQLRGELNGWVLRHIGSTCQGSNCEEKSGFKVLYKHNFRVAR